MEREPVVLCEKIMLPKSGASAYLVTLNRPDRLNCFNFQVCHELSNIFSTLLREDSCDLVIFTGAGKNFCAGADLSNPPNPLEASSDLPQNLVDNPIHQMSLLQVPIIGAIQGHCITGGFELALGCDILVGDERTKFRDSHVKFGLAPCWGLSQKLQRRVGPGRASLISLTAQVIPGPVAHEWGLLDALAKDGQSVLDKAMEIADQICSNNITMVKRYKRAIVEGGKTTLQHGLQRERELALSHYLEALNDGATFENAKDYITDETRGRTSKRMQSKL